MIAGLVLMAVAIFITDVLVKQSIEDQLEMQEERLVLGGKVLIRRVHNKGMALNLLDDYPNIVAVLSGGMGLILIIYDAVLLMRKRHFLEKIGMMFLTGGALSNVFDRFVRGEVVDYIGFQTKWKKFTDITFNLGDFAIMLGSLLAGTSRVFCKKKKKRKKKKLEKKNLKTNNSNMKNLNIRKHSPASSA